MYVPALRWRTGEYQALLRLDPAVKEKIVPLLQIPPVEFDFETRMNVRTVHAHVFPFVNRYMNKWRGHAWISLDDSIALGRMEDGSHVFDHVFDGLRHQAQAIPAISLSSDPRTLAAAAKALKKDGNGVGIIVSLVDLAGADCRTRITHVLSTLGLPVSDADLIVDLSAPNFEPYEVLASLLIAKLGLLSHTSIFRNFIMISTAYPESFENVKWGTDSITRHDWLFYKDHLVANSRLARRPVYGDYTVVHPNFTAIDMRRVKPMAKIAYTSKTGWHTRTGLDFRGNRNQMHDHCKEIVTDEIFGFRGEDFSYGDGYIAKCARREKGPSNLTIWKQVMINHHITMVVDDLASLCGSTSPF